MSNLILSSCGRYLCDENTGEIIDYNPRWVIGKILELFKENKTFFLACFQPLTEIVPPLWEFQEITDPNFCFLVFGNSDTVKLISEHHSYLFTDENDPWDDQIVKLLEYYPHAVEVWSTLTSR